MQDTKTLNRFVLTKRRHEHSAPKCHSAVDTFSSPTAARTRLTMSERKAVIKNADMNQELQEDAVDVAARVIACLNDEVWLSTCVYYPRLRVARLLPGN